MEPYISFTFTDNIIMDEIMENSSSNPEYIKKAMLALDILNTFSCVFESENFHYMEFIRLDFIGSFLFPIIIMIKFIIKYSTKYIIVCLYLLSFFKK